MKFLANYLEFTCFREHLENSDITYLSAGSVDQLLTCISNKIESDTLNTLNNEVCFAIMADETCDEGNLEQFDVYSKFAYEGSTEHYLGIIHVENITSEGLMTTLSDFFFIAKACLSLSTDVIPCLEGSKEFNDYSDTSRYSRCMLIAETTNLPCVLCI